MFWVGEQRKDGSVPAWIFYVIEQSMVDNLKGAITKAIFETNHQKLVSEAKISGAKSGSDLSSDNGGDTQWLESTIVADR